MAGSSGLVPWCQGCEKMGVMCTKRLGHCLLEGSVGVGTGERRWGRGNLFKEEEIVGMKGWQTGQMRGKICSERYKYFYQSEAKRSNVSR